MQSTRTNTFILTWVKHFSRRWVLMKSNPRSELSFAKIENRVDYFCCLHSLLLCWVIFVCYLLTNALFETLSKTTVFFKTVFEIENIVKLWLVAMTSSLVDIAIITWEFRYTVLPEQIVKYSSGLSSYIIL